MADGTGQWWMPTVAIRLAGTWGCYKVVSLISVSSSKAGWKPGGLFPRHMGERIEQCSLLDCSKRGEVLHSSCCPNCWECGQQSLQLPAQWRWPELQRIASGQAPPSGRADFISAGGRTERPGQVGSMQDTCDGPFILPIFLQGWWGHWVSLKSPFLSLLNPASFPLLLSDDFKATS